jgi:hypothetical protein
MRTGGSDTSRCPYTGLSQPECSCPRCLTDQIRRFQPDLLEADPIGDIRVTRNLGQADDSGHRRAA